ncbi:hypothetical protein JW992_11135 [candidate division KSB1 bacterium]|nr:hypothetical protein [candidate division KSB1 bacterium]
MQQGLTADVAYPELYFGNSNIRTRLWCIAGAGRGCGKTTLTAGIGGWFARQGHFVHMLNTELPDTQFIEKQDFELRGDFSLDELFEHMDSRFVDSLHFIISNALGSSDPNREGKLRHIVLDQSSYVTGEALDFFLVADYPVVVMQPTLVSLDEMIAFLNACLFRLIEHVMPDREDQLALVAERLKKQKKWSAVSDDLGALCSECDSDAQQRMQASLNGFRPLVLLNRFQEPVSYRFLINYIESYFQPLLPGIAFLGALPEDRLSARFASALNYLFISSQSDPRLKHIARYLAARLRQKLLTPAVGMRDFIVGHDTLYVDDLFSVRNLTTQSPTEPGFDVRNNVN